MARKKSATYQGSSPFDVDVDQMTLRRVWENIAGDLALVFDKATGENAETEVCNHDGTSGRGARLGVPVVNQFIGRRLFFEGGSKTAKDGGVGPTWLYAVPVFIPPGEAEYTVVIATDGGPVATFSSFAPTVYFRDAATFAAVGDDRVALNVREMDGVSCLTARIRNVTTGQRLFFFEVNTSALFDSSATDDTSFYFGSISVSPMRRRSGGRGVFPPMLSTSPFGVTTPGAAQGVVPVDYDAAAFDEGFTINGHMVFRHNRLINALYEYITGWRAGGNATRTLADHDGAGAADAVDPARSRALAHTRSLYASEPEVDWPLWCNGFGAFKLDGGLVVDAASPPTTGMLDWFAPFRVATTTAAGTKQIMRQLALMCPDFQTATSRLKWMVLVGTDSGTITQYTAHVGAGGADGTAAFAAITTPTGAKLALAQGTALAFTADTLVVANVGLSKSAAIAAADEAVLLGACLYFDP